MSGRKRAELEGGQNVIALEVGVVGSVNAPALDGLYAELRRCRDPVARAGRA